VISEQCSISKASDAFDDSGQLKDAKSQAALVKVATVLTQMCRALGRPDLNG
jgi:hypothetical protein